MKKHAEEAQPHFISAVGETSHFSYALATVGESGKKTCAAVETKWRRDFPEPDVQFVLQLLHGANLS